MANINRLINLLSFSNKKKKALRKCLESASFRVNIDSRTDSWSLKNINIGETTKISSGLNTSARSNSNLSLNTTHGLTVDWEPRLYKRRSSSTSYLNEEDDYDNDINKLEYLKKFKRQLSIDKPVKRSRSHNGLPDLVDHENKSLYHLKLDSTTKDAIEALNIESDSNSDSG